MKRTNYFDPLTPQEYLEHCIRAAEREHQYVVALTKPIEAMKKDIEDNLPLKPRFDPNIPHSYKDKPNQDALMREAIRQQVEKMSHDQLVKLYVELQRAQKKETK